MVELIIWILKFFDNLKDSKIRVHRFFPTQSEEILIWVTIIDWMSSALSKIFTTNTKRIEIKNFDKRKTKRLNDIPKILI